MTTKALPGRWRTHTYHPEQRSWYSTTALFAANWSGRRSGKTEILKRYAVRQALRYSRTDDGWFVLSAPTHAQAKRIFWADLKRLIPRQYVAKIIESELTIRLVTGTEITVLGMDKPERIEGRPLDGFGGDEWASMKPGLWEENILPALGSVGRPQGWARICGVPEGRNHWYELAMDWQARERAGSPDHATFHWHSASVLPEEMIARLEANMDELTADQELRASFVNYTGRAYLPFTRETHCAPVSKLYRPHEPLIFCFDFNISPGTAVVCQELEVRTALPGLVPGERITCCIGEVYIKRNSTTRAVCRRLVQDWGEHPGEVRVYGDATGGSGGTASVDGSDVDLIDIELRHFGDRYANRFERSNPRERARVNAMNSRLESADGAIRMLVDDAACPYLVKDFEGVTVLEGGSGELDKKTSPELTHLTDGLGYYVCEEFPLLGTALERREI